MRGDSGRSSKIAVFAALATIPLAHRAGIDLLSIGPFIALLPVAGIVLDDRRALQASAADLKLPEHPEDSEVCLVRLSIDCGERRIGVDRGLCWFAEERLHFLGHATSFVLGGQDIVPTTERPATPNTIDLRHPSEEVSLCIVPLRQRGEIGAMRQACFAHLFAAFRDGASPAAGARQWPPFQPWSGVK